MQSMASNERMVQVKLHVKKHPTVYTLMYAHRSWNHLQFVLQTLQTKIHPYLVTHMYNLIFFIILERQIHHKVTIFSDKLLYRDKILLVSFLKKQ